LLLSPPEGEDPSVLQSFGLTTQCPVS